MDGGVHILPDLPTTPSARLRPLAAENMIIPESRLTARGGARPGAVEFPCWRGLWVWIG